ncbi:cytochrome P450 [Nocardia rhamnosiphila]|uniref:cytochrome P450 n=1 Tax=Nocardia rhamnosiphila TaxID=426716 RepID=UPI003411B723
MLRKLVRHTSSASYVQQVRRESKKLLTAALDTAMADGGCDASEDLSLCLPMGALIAIFGLTLSNARELIALTRSMIGIEDPFFGGSVGGDDLQLSSIHADMLSLFDEVLTYRRQNPGDDLITYMLGAEVNGDELTDEEILLNCINLAVGGNETSSYTASTGVYLLAENEYAPEALLANPELMDRTIAEILRWSSTNCYVLRKCTSDFHLNGTLIRRGELVTLWNVSANRDKSVFDDPDRFNIFRSPNRHLAYGAGIHRCVGTPLAGVELEVFFREIVSRKIRFTLDDDVRWLRSNFINGPVKLSVSIDKYDRPSNLVSRELISSPSRPDDRTAR